MNKTKINPTFIKKDKITLLVEDDIPGFYIRYNKGVPIKMQFIRGTRKELLNRLDVFGDGCLGVIPDEKLIVVRNGDKLYLTPYEERKI